MGTYTTVFDLTGHPAGIQLDYVPFGFCIVAGLALAFAFFGLSKTKPAMGIVLTVVSVIWVGAWIFSAVTNTRDVNALRDRVKAGDYKTVEGCIGGFGHEGGGRRGVTEFWTAGGLKFSYLGGQLHPTYHRIEQDGGFVHADSKVRVTYAPVGKYGNREIVRLEVIDHGCPAATAPATA